MTEVSKKAGEMWAKIDSDTKDRFEKKAKAAKEKYEEDYKVNLKTVLGKNSVSNGRVCTTFSSM